MVLGRKVYAVLIGALAIAVVVRADMLPISGLDADRWPVMYASNQTDLLQADSFDLLGWPDFDNLNSFSVGFLPDAPGNARQTHETQGLLISDDGQTSINLCVYALIGLGLCRSAHWLKRLSLGVIPDWYHNGGPYQTGHSHAISPDCLHSMPVCCFFQPDETAEDSMPQHHRGIVVSRWRRSQFTPLVLVPRGPPLCSLWLPRPHDCQVPNLVAVPSHALAQSFGAARKEHKYHFRTNGETVMKRSMLLSTICVLMAGPAVADLVLPEGFTPEEGGVYLMGTEAGNSWTQRILVWNWQMGGSPDHFQFRICTNPADSDYPQSFVSPSAFQVAAYGVGDYTSQFNEGHAAHLGVDDAMLWASGPTLPGQGPVIRLTFHQGSAITYPNPYNATWSDTPEFVLQMQAYVGETRAYNKEFYFTGTQWLGDDSVEQPSPALASGYTHDVLGKDWACPEWTLSEPVPAPAAVALGILGLGAAGWRLRRSA